eukprot:5290876-Pyramimonas_sp.AAC.1
MNDKSFTLLFVLLPGDHSVAGVHGATVGVVAVDGSQRAAQPPGVCSARRGEHLLGGGRAKPGLHASQGGAGRTERPLDVLMFRCKRKHQ